MGCLLAKGERVEWIDSRGRYFQVELLDEDPSHGLIVGPPLELMDKLTGLSPAARVRLHNELYHREILTEADISARPREAEAALKAALKIDVGRVMEAYRGIDEDPT